MNIIAQTSRPYSIGVDTIATLTTTNVTALKAAGYIFAVRYLGGLTVSEVYDILAGGMALMPVTYSRGGGWTPSAMLGVSDGNSTVASLHALGLPKGITVWCDLEGMGGVAADTIAYANAWAVAVKAAGYIPGAYIGAGIPLNSSEIYKLVVSAYWHSCSQVPDVDTCGYMMIQLYPPNAIICGVEVDIDVIESDHKNRLPIWAVSQ